MISKKACVGWPHTVQEEQSRSNPKCILNDAACKNRRISLAYSEVFSQSTVAKSSKLWLVTLQGVPVRVHAPDLLCKVYQSTYMFLICFARCTSYGTCSWSALQGIPVTVHALGLLCKMYQSLYILMIYFVRCTSQGTCSWSALQGVPSMYMPLICPQIYKVHGEPLSTCSKFDIAWGGWVPMIFF